MAYAKDTIVPTHRSREEIERLLDRYGITPVQWTGDSRRGPVVLRFQWTPKGSSSPLMIRMSLAAPDPREFSLPGRGKAPPSPADVQARIEKEMRRRHRSLLLDLKGRFTSMEDGIATDLETWLPFIEHSSGQTFAEMVSPHVGRLTSSTPLLPLVKP